MDASRLDYLDGWRGLAIAFLLLGHLFPVRGIDFGIVGVNLFFVLSGLLMARLLFVSEVPIATFYRRRISRIFPAFFSFISIVVLAHAASGSAISWTQVLAAASFLTNYAGGDHVDSVLPFGHIWSLCVEEHSYILLSGIAVLARRKLVGATVATACCATAFALCGVYYWTRYSGPQLDFHLWRHSEVSAYGIFVSAAVFLFLQGRRIPRLPALALPVLLALGMAIHWWSVPLPVRTIVGVGIFALAVNLLSRSSDLVRSFLALRPLRQLGIWSFSIYVWQQPFHAYVHQGRMSGWLALCVSLILGIGSYYLLEKPVREYLNRNWTGRTPGVSTPQTPVR